MKTHELLKLDSAEMADSIKNMDGKECEKHARKLARKCSVPYDKALIAATYGIIASDKDAPVAERVSSSVWKVASESDCPESDSEILAVLLLMLIYHRTDGFKFINVMADNLSKHA